MSISAEIQTDQCSIIHSTISRVLHVHVYVGAGAPLHHTPASNLLQYTWVLYSRHLMLVKQIVITLVRNVLHILFV